MDTQAHLNWPLNSADLRLNFIGHFREGLLHVVRVLRAGLQEDQALSARSAYGDAIR